MIIFLCKKVTSRIIRRGREISKSGVLFSRDGKAGRRVHRVGSDLRCAASGGRLHPEAVNEGQRPRLLLVDLADDVDNGVVAVHDHAHDAVLVADGIGFAHQGLGLVFELPDGIDLHTGPAEFLRHLGAAGIDGHALVRDHHVHHRAGGDDGVDPVDDGGDAAPGQGGYHHGEAGPRR